MKVDSRGRVRFTHNKVRVEVTNTGVRTYRRLYNSACGDVEYSSWFGLNTVVRTKEGRALLEEALRTLRQHNNCRGWYAKVRTVNTIIPKHMRAV